MRASALRGYATATDLADYLVKKGIPFRDAHEIVAKAVQFAEQKSCDLSKLALDELQQFSIQIESDIFAVLTLEGSMNSRNHTGGTAPEQVQAAIQKAKAWLTWKM
jgi:argininosuccinate lyase